MHGRVVVALWTLCVIHQTAWLNPQGVAGLSVIYFPLSGTEWTEGGRAGGREMERANEGENPSACLSFLEVYLFHLFPCKCSA